MLRSGKHHVSCVCLEETLTVINHQNNVIIGLVLFSGRNSGSFLVVNCYFMPQFFLLLSNRSIRLLFCYLSDFAHEHKNHHQKLKTLRFNLIVARSRTRREAKKTKLENVSKQLPGIFSSPQQTSQQ